MPVCRKFMHYMLKQNIEEMTTLDINKFEQILKFRHVSELYMFQ